MTNVQIPNDQHLRKGASDRKPLGHWSLGFGHSLVIGYLVIGHSPEAPMFRMANWLTTWFLFAFAAPVFAAAPTFKDRARLFSPEAADGAKALMDEIRAELHKNVAVETFKA